MGSEKKILVLGSRGMAGHVILKYLKEQGHCVLGAAKSYADLIIDVDCVDSIDDCLRNRSWDIVINCIGLLVKDSNTDFSKAIKVNSWFPHYLAQQLKDTDSRLIHLSTDCVFSGQRGQYDEKYQPDETNNYGKTKAMGEINNGKDLTVRLSIIGPELKQGTGLLNWILTSSDHDLPGWKNAIWNGITTLELARCLNMVIDHPKITGLYHLVNNNNKISKYDLLVMINEIWQLNKNIQLTTNFKDIDKTLLDTRLLLDWNIPDYNTQLSNLKTWYEQNF